MRGLRFLHEHRIRHGDIKTGNVFIDKANNAKIGDVGTLRWLERQQDTNPALGTRTWDYANAYTPGYEAPEVAYNQAVRERVRKCGYTASL